MMVSVFSVPFLFFLYIFIVFVFLYWSSFGSCHIFSREGVREGGKVARVFVASLVSHFSYMSGFKLCCTLSLRLFKISHQQRRICRSFFPNFFLSLLLLLTSCSGYDWPGLSDMASFLHCFTPHFFFKIGRVFFKNIKHFFSLFLSFTLRGVFIALWIFFPFFFFSSFSFLYRRCCVELCVVTIALYFFYIPWKI